MGELTLVIAACSWDVAFFFPVLRFARFRRQCGHTWGRQTQVGLLQTGGLNKLEPMIDIKRCRHMHV